MHFLVLLAYECTISHNLYATLLLLLLLHAINHNHRSVIFDKNSLSRGSHGVRNKLQDIG